MTDLVPFPTDLPTVVLRCRPWGVPALLILVLPVEGPRLLGAFWNWHNTLIEAPIGRA